MQWRTFDAYCANTYILIYAHMALTAHGWWLMADGCWLLVDDGLCKTGDAQASQGSRRCLRCVTRRAARNNQTTSVVSEVHKRKICDAERGLHHSNERTLGATETRRQCRRLLYKKSVKEWMLLLFSYEIELYTIHKSFHLRTHTHTEIFIHM